MGAFTEGFGRCWCMRQSDTMVCDAHSFLFFALTAPLPEWQSFCDGTTWNTSIASQQQDSLMEMHFMIYWRYTHQYLEFDVANIHTDSILVHYSMYCRFSFKKIYPCKLHLCLHYIQNPCWPDMYDRKSAGTPVKCSQRLPKVLLLRLALLYLD